MWWKHENLGRWVEVHNGLIVILSLNISALSYSINYSRILPLGGELPSGETICEGLITRGVEGVLSPCSEVPTFSPDIRL